MCETGVHIMEIGSKEITAAAIRLAITDSRQSENQVKAELAEMGIKSVAIDYGGEFMTAVPKILERAVIAAKREGVIGSSHAEEGAVAGAAHEAVNQKTSKPHG